ncbi:unnamed protein product [Closterium sp. NIES-54]
MYITLYFIVTRLPDSLRAVRDHFLALDPTDLTVDLLEKHLLATETSVVAVSAARGTPRTPSYASAAAVDILGIEDVGAISAPSGKRRSGKGKGGKSGGSGSGGDWCAEFGNEAERPRWLELLRSGVDIFALEYDAILAAMYALTVCVKIAPTHPPPSAAAAAVGDGGGGGAGDATHPPSHRLENNNILTVCAEGDCYLCVPPKPGIEVAALGASESALPGTALAEALHTFTLESCASCCFFRDSTTPTPLPAPVSVRLADPSGGPVLARSSTVLPCPAVSSGSLSDLHLPSFSTNLTLTTEPPQVAASGQVSASGPVAALCLCRLMSHQTLLRHHCIGHPSLPRLHGLHSRLLVSGLPRSLHPLPPSPAAPCIPCIEGRQRAAPHSSSFPMMTAPLQTLYMDVWGPARVSGQDRERYFLLFLEDLPVLRLHSDRGGEFSSDLLRDFCCGEGILQLFTLLASPQNNGVTERRIGLVMEVALTSMIYATAPHFLWPFAVWGSRAFVRDTSADKLSSRAIPYVFLGFHPDVRGWQFYHPNSRRVLSSHNVTFDDSVPFYRLFPYRTAPLPPLPLFLAPGPPPEDPLLPQGAEPAGAELGSAEPASAEPGGAEPEGAEPGGAETEGAKPGGAESRGAESEGAEPRGTASAGGPAGAGVTAGAGGTRGAGAAGPGGARTRGTRAAGAGGVGGAGAGDPGARRTGAGGTRAGDPGAGGAGAGGAGAGAGAGDPGAGGGGAGGTRAGDPRAGGTGARDPGAGGAGAGGAGAGGARAGGAGAGGTGAGDPRAGGAGAKGAGAGGTGAGGTVQRRPFFVPPLSTSLLPPGSVLRQVLSLPSSTGLTPRILCPLPHQSQPQLQPDSPLHAPSPYAKHADSFTERREPESRPASPVRAVRTGQSVPRLRPPPVPDTHIMALRPSSVPLQVSLPSPIVSSLADDPDPKSDLVRVASPTVPRLLATVVTDPSFESAAAPALVAELVDFAVACRLDYTASLVAESECASPLSVKDSHGHRDGILEVHRHIRRHSFPSWELPGPPASSLPHVPDPESDLARAATPTVTRLLATVITDPGFESTAAFARVNEVVDFAARSHLDYVASLVTESESVCPQSVGGEPSLSSDALEDMQFELECLAAAIPHFASMTTLAALGFAPSTADPSLFLRTDTSLPPFYVLVYVNDLVIATADTEALTLVKSELQKRHTCTDLGELRNYLGLHITRDRARRTITLTQSHMVHQVLQRFSFWYSSPMFSPLPTGHSLSAPPLDKSVEPSGSYPELVGCLMYLMTCTRPDLAYPLSILARYVAPGRHQP